MTGILKPAAWIDAIDQHYLSDYIAAGGSAVKFVTSFPDVEGAELMRQFQTRCTERGFLVAQVDGAATKLHQIEQWFGRIADQIPWNTLAERKLACFARENHWQVPDVFSSAGMVEQLEQVNGLGVQQISLELQRRIATDILADRRLAKDFRIAMHWLTRARLEAGIEGEVIRQHLTDWLGGRIGRVGDLRRYQIFTKVNRANARYLLSSLLVWIRDAGFAGLIMIVDGFRLMSGTRATDGSVHYTKASRWDAYEVFREFIDSTDDFEGLLLTIFMPREFITIDNKSPGLGEYPPLLYRVYDEVRDRHLANPLSALARISNTEEVLA